MTNPPGTTQQKWKLLLVPTTLLPCLIYAFFRSGSLSTEGIMGGSSSNIKAPITTSTTDSYEFPIPLRHKLISCGLLFAPRSDHLHPLSTVVIDSEEPTSTITYKTLEEHDITEMMEHGNWISAGSLWLKMGNEEGTVVPAPAIKVVNDPKLDYSLKLGMDFLRDHKATLKGDDGDALYIRVASDDGDDDEKKGGGNEKEVLIPYVLPKLPFEGEALDKKKISTDDKGDSASTILTSKQLFLREQIPCGVILPSNDASSSSSYQVHPVTTVVDSTVATSSITRTAATELGLTEFVQHHNNDVIPPDAFSLRMDEATVPSPLLRIVEDDHDAEYPLTLGMFFLNENGAKMKNGDLYIEANGKDEVLIPFIQKRESISFDEAKEEL